MIYLAIDDAFKARPAAVRDAARVSGGFADPSEWMEEAGLKADSRALKKESAAAREDRAAA